MAFNFRREYGQETVQNRTMCGLSAKEEEELEQMMMLSSSEEDDEKEKMDEGDDDEEVFEVYEYPTHIVPMIEYHHDAQSGKDSFKFLRNKIPETFPFTSPNLLLGLDSIDEISADQKRTLVGATALPMPVHSSPIVSFFATKVEGKAVTPWKPKYVNWMYSAHQLREFMFLAQSGLIPVPPTVSKDLVVTCYEDFEYQIDTFDTMQFDRIQDLFRMANEDPSCTQQCLIKFIEYLEEASFHYLHTCERFLWKALIEPHNPENLELQDVLTPYDKPTLGQCNNPFETRQLVVDYFDLKVRAFREKDKERAEEGYVFKDTINLDTLKNRIMVHNQTQEVRYNCAPQHVYRGWIGLEAIYQYWLFCDTGSLLGEDWHQRWNLSMWK